MLNYIEHLPDGPYSCLAFLDIVCATSSLGIVCAIFCDAQLDIFSDVCQAGSQFNPVEQPLSLSLYIYIYVL